MPGSRLLLACLLPAFFAACSDNTQPVVPAPLPVSSPASSPASASVPYGLIADISFEGDISQFSNQAKIVVFIRNAESSMPLAVEQFEVAQLPRSVSFASDTPQSNIELVTRLSPDGKINKSANDIEVVTNVGMLEHPPKTFPISLGADPKSVATNTDKKVVLRVHVSVSLTAILPDDAGLRVIVRGDDEIWPIASRSLKVSDLPTVLTFTDLDAMSLKQSLSSSKKLTISALPHPTETGRESAPVSLSSRESVEVDTANIPDMVHLEFGG